MHRIQMHLILAVPILSFSGAVLTADMPPQPGSPVIERIEWSPPETIVRLARGSDNWPITWGDDDALYSAYGDGRGFRPFVEKKLSLGLVRITGGPENPRGENLRSPSAEQIGDGKNGKKASGLLMVDGVLYMWVRNAGNSQIASSDDRGKTWEWADWKFTESFGCPTFLNFGRNYSSARDDYVYTFSHDSDSAYEPADAMVLARVPKRRILDRTAWQFFAGLDKNQRPVWTAEINERRPVFEAAGRCYRNGISYNAGLKRYLWCQTWPGGDTRFAGGLVVLDAPEPWGPWTTAFATEKWDVGPGETSHFPTKWMSDDGRTLHLVFSGDDHFSVRRAVMHLRDDRESVQFPGKDWPRAAPESVGLDAKLLERAREYALTGEGSGYIIRHGKLVMNWGDPRRRYDLKSTTKSIGVTALGLAILDGHVQLTDKAITHHPEFGVPPQSNQETGWLDDVTLLHLATQTAGFEKPGGYQPLLFEPGTKWHYSDGGPNWLAECLTLKYQRDLRDVMFDRLFTRMGITSGDLTWRNNSYRPKQIAGIPRREFGSGISANVDAMSRIGYLYLHDGKWNDEQLIPREFVALASRPVDFVKELPVHDDKRFGNASAHYGLLWWNNADGTLENVPRDAYWSWGLYDSLIVVIPSLDLVVARAGKSWDRRWDGHYDVLAPFLLPICEAVIDSSQPAKRSQ